MIICQLFTQKEVRVHEPLYRLTLAHGQCLIGPGKYIDELVPIDGEDYPRIIIQGSPLKVTTDSNLEVTVSF